MAQTNKKRLRNLAQYRHLSDEEFDQIWDDYKSQESSPDIEQKIQETMQRFSEDYDLSDMNANDRLALRELAKIFILLDDLYEIERKAIENGEMMKISAISKIRKDLIDGSSKIQADLNITRKSRQTDVGESLDTYLPSILKKARNFLSQRLSYIYCPQCRMLTANTWFADWEQNNTVTITCPRQECGHVFSVSSKMLAENKNKNVDNVLNV